ncbi:DUF167 domain-containing protein [Cryobacterium frigoriphilum]|uniref:UPF0235 protein E3T55_12265 n=1 Tax=Cryobacterium frigoriphilum TaxID=1259150 RepID=A0A4R8ZYE7_9MICO|nr:DUF167 domain-containing protein [Cryobacterium frigoriphilum]TFD48827.1 DUF167 domain-containing protein [Cryobacterium frigoriphilum]
MSITLNLTVHVKPGSRKGPLVVTDDDADDSVTVFLQQRAVEGAANDALVKILAKHFGVAKRDVDIVRGHASRIKHVRIDRTV